MKPLFMWAGGKNKMLKKYAPHLPENFTRYIEPFFGGGAMFVWAYQKNPEASFVINDINPSIMGIYRAIRDDVTAFTARVDDLSSNYLPKEKAARKEYYYELRLEHAYEYEKWNATTEAATLYFLMKTGFNGIWQINKNTNNRFGTPSGLLNQKDKVYDIENVMEWHIALQKCVLLSGDFSGTLGSANSDAFIFLDPPYRGSFTQYGVDFDDNLQREVVNYLNKAADRGAKVLMSNRDVGDGFFEELQGDNDMVYFDVTYTAGRRKKEEDGSHTAKKAREILMISRTPQ
jgi:DNA adenine methylase